MGLLNKINNKIDTWMSIIQDRIVLYFLRKRDFQKEIPFLREIHKTKDSVEYEMRYIGDIYQYRKWVSEEDIDNIDMNYDHIRIRILNEIHDLLKRLLSINDSLKQGTYIEVYKNKHIYREIKFGSLYTVKIHFDILKLTHQWISYRSYKDCIVDVDKYIARIRLRDAIQSQKTKLENYRQNILF